MARLFLSTKKSTNRDTHQIVGIFFAIYDTGKSSEQITKDTFKVVLLSKYTIINKLTNHLIEMPT